MKIVYGKNAENIFTVKIITKSLLIYYVLNVYFLAISGESHAAHKHQAKSGKKAHHDHEVASKGKSEVTHHKTISEEGAGKKSKSHAQGGHQASKNAGGHSEHGAKFEEGGKHKKNGFEKVRNY